MAVWHRPRWQPDGPAVERVDDEFLIELQHVEKLVSALNEIITVLADVDPENAVIYGGDLELRALT